jgi:hypothetical protein
MIVSGCAEVIAYNKPQIAVDETISTVPIALFVATAKRPPKPTAGAKHAKKRNIVAARLCTRHIEVTDQSFATKQR